MIFSHFTQLLKKDNPRSYPFTNPIDWIVAFITVCIGGLFLLYIQDIGITLHLIDQYSHLSISRQITDSMTPGMSQVGFWPPLLHLLLAPFAFFDGLFYSGFAAAVLLVPVLALGVVFFARSVYLLTDNKLIGYISGLTLLLNPYILYYSVTPMMETLFLSTLFGALYFFVHWWRYQTLTSLVWLGLFVSLATMARFEGFMLLVLVSLFVLGKTWRDRKYVTEIEATLTIFGLIAGTGLVFIVGYGWTYGGGLLAFMNNSWSAYTQQRDLVLPAEHNWIEAFVYLFGATEVVVGLSLLVVSAVFFLLLLVISKYQRNLYLAVLLILSSPFLFDLMALYQGSAVIYLPSLPPYPDTFFNARYGLLAIGVLIMVPALVAARLGQYFYQRGKIIQLHTIAPLVVMVLLIHAMVGHAQDTACRECFSIITNSIQVVSANRIGAAEVLSENYNGGYVLMTRALNNEIAVEAGLPLRNYILEGNEHYYPQAISQPWWYASYVVMYNTDSDEFQPWMLENELISKRWAGSEIFEEYYEPIYSSGTEMVYQLKHEFFKQEVINMGLDPSVFPSLNPQASWDTASTHSALEELMKQPKQEHVPGWNVVSR